MSLPTVYGPCRPLLDEELQVWEDEEEQPFSTQGNDPALLFRDPDRLIPSIEVNHNYNYVSPNSSARHGTNANNDQSKRRSDTATGRASSPTNPSDSDSSDGTHNPLSGRRRPRTKHCNHNSGKKEKIPTGKVNKHKNKNNNDIDSLRQRPKRVYSKPRSTNYLSRLWGAGGLSRRASSHSPVTTDLSGLYNIQGPTAGEEREERHDGGPSGSLKGGPGGEPGGGCSEGRGSAGGGPDNFPGAPPEGRSDSDR
ncbi:hypothetical protein BDW67DRAFT_171530 [Aspergillus spinulosporus]